MCALPTGGRDDPRRRRRRRAQPDRRDGRRPGARRPDSPLPLDDAGTDMAGAMERLAHVEELRPEICTLDCGTMNFAAGGDYVMANTPEMLRAMARPDQGARRPARARGVRHRPSGDRQGAARRGADRGSGADPALHGDPVRRAGRPADAARPGQPAARRARSSRPSRSAGCSFRTSAMAVLVGGNVRVGLEDNLYAGPGEQATNAQLVRARDDDPRGDERARARTADEVRERLRLRGRESAEHIAARRPRCSVAG